MIIIYFHICQKGEWKRSFLMSFEQIKASGLYDECQEIRCGVVNDGGALIGDPIFHDPKIKVVALGRSAEYERLTLHHMRQAAETEVGAKYLYCHTKGLMHFGTHREESVLDWIRMLVYFNIERWRLAKETLDTFDTYGCNYFTDGYPQHYSGNFWWANASYIKTLPKTIGPAYLDPEFWVLSKEPKYFVAFSSGINHYDHRFLPSQYRVS